MKFNIASATIFICAAAGFFVFKEFYLEKLYFEQPEVQVVERIRNNNDIEQLKSVAEGLVVLESGSSKSYNAMLASAVNVFFWLSFLAAILAIGAILEVRQKSSHSNKSLKKGTPTSGAP